MADGNKSLRRASIAKEDEFYTQIADIEREMRHYIQYFKDKTIFLNCDDPETSNFWKYFELNFDRLGLKRLISTHYETDKPSYKLELTGDVDGNGRTDKHDIVRTTLRQNGDFRSPECIEIMKGADIVITNPPFSLFRDYIAQLIEYDKKFIVIGRETNVGYKEIFPLIKDNKIWLGYYSGDMAFTVPDYYEERKTRYWVDENGQKWRSLGNACWFTNLDTTLRHEELKLFKQYNPIDYPKYENYDAIEVRKIVDIPCDYYGIMGVPANFLSKYNPDQFEIVGLGNGYLGQSIGITGIPKEHKKLMKGHSAAGDLYYMRDGKPIVPFTRVLIRRKGHNNEN